MRIAPLAVLADEQAQTQKLNEAKALAGELQVRTFTLSYAQGRGSRSGHPDEVGAVGARPDPDRPAHQHADHAWTCRTACRRRRRCIATLDKPQPQVEVEARVVQTTRDFARALGIQWGFNGRANSQIGNTTGLTFPNNGAIGGATGQTTQAPTDPRGGPAANGATVINLPDRAGRDSRRSAWRSARSTARSTSTSR